MNKQKIKKKKFPAIVRWIGLVLLVQLILINISAAFYAYRLTHFYEGDPTTTTTTSGNIFSKTWRLFTGPRQIKSKITELPAYPYETIQLKTASGLSIEGWYSQPATPARGTVIIFHGITVNKSIMLEEAYEFRQWGYNVLLVDLRAHGNSEGQTTTIGFRESEEVKLAYEYALQRGNQRIFLFGASLGAVVVARAVDQYQLKPAGIFLDMPFASLQSYLRNKARILGFPSQPFAFLTTLWIGVERGFNGYKHLTTSYVKNISCPVLMQWGQKDEFILQEETNRIYNAIGSKDKKLIVYPNAQHESFLRRDPTTWRIEVGAFLEKH